MTWPMSVWSIRGMDFSWAGRMSANSKVASPAVAVAFLRDVANSLGWMVSGPLQWQYADLGSEPQTYHTYSGSPTVLDLARRVRAIPTMV